jgi:hypothetical protein
MFTPVMPDQQINPEKPIYVLEQKKIRALIPKLISFIGLGIVFYLGILLNLSIINLNAKDETIVKTSSLILLLAIIIVGIYLSFHRAHLNYKFYRTGIIFNRKEMKYINIINIQPNINFWDKLFKTYSMAIGNKFFLRHIPQETNLQQYLQQLINFSKRNH